MIFFRCPLFFLTIKATTPNTNKNEIIFYKNIEDFYLKNKEANMVYFSSSATKNYTSINFQDNMFFLFGKESEGLPKEIVKKNLDKLYKIPIYTNHVRSLNLANAVSIVVYEGLRNLKKL